MVDLLAAQQIQMTTILKDKVFREWFAKAPFLPRHSRYPANAEPWFLYLQKEEDGKWSRAPVQTYGQAYRWIGTRLKDYWDFAIVSRTKAYYPPIYRPVTNGKKAKSKVYWASYPGNHAWCPYCRRPVIFRTFERHHSITPIHVALGIPGSPPQSRCSICGIREESVKLWTRLGR